MTQDEIFDFDGFMNNEEILMFTFDLLGQDKWLVNDPNDQDCPEEPEEMRVGRAFLPFRSAGKYLKCKNLSIGGMTI
jgi:hypothetical protein